MTISIFPLTAEDIEPEAFKQLNVLAGHVKNIHVAAMPDMNIGKGTSRMA